MKENKQSIEKRPPSIYFLAASPLGTSPSQRFRFEHYLPVLRQHNIKYKVSPYFSQKGKRALYSTSNNLRKVYYIVMGAFKRMADMLRIARYDFVYVHREAAPIGPPVWEWVVAKVLRKKMVYDFDDAIWLPVISNYNKRFAFVKFFGKIAKICKWSYKVSVGNAFLQSYANRFNNNTVIIPTVVNTETAHNSLQKQDVSKPAVGWTGSFSTLMYLQIVLPVLQKLQDELDFTFYVIADVDPCLPLKNYRFIKWNRETESTDLLNFHIGLMPLTDDDLSKGKCGFKAIQYMAMGIPALVSPVGVNTEIVDEGINGFYCNSAEEWENRIRQLLKDSFLRIQMSKAAREKIEKNYSVNYSKTIFLNLFLEEQNNDQRGDN